MGASPLHPTRDGRPWTRFRTQVTTTSYNVPVKRRETNDAHGHGGFCRQPDALHPGKTEKTAAEKIYFLPCRFSVFIVPVELLVRSLCCLRKKVCSSAPVCRIPESRGGTPLARGYGGCASPCLKRRFFCFRLFRFFQGFRVFCRPAKRL